MSQYKVPSLLDLQKNPDEALEHDELLKLLHQPTPAFLVKLNKFNDNKPYVPIDRVKWLLTMIFRRWKVEIKSVSMHANSEVVVVRLHYMLPSGEWEWQDGVGAHPLQTDKGFKPSDLSAIKDKAVQMSAPSAESYAIKDAADKIGPIFGDSLKEIMPFEPFKPDDVPSVPTQVSQPLPNPDPYPGYYQASDGQWYPTQATQPVQQPIQQQYAQPQFNSSIYF